MGKPVFYQKIKHSNHEVWSKGQEEANTSYSLCRGRWFQLWVCNACGLLFTGILCNKSVHIWHVTVVVNFTWAVSCGIIPSFSRHPSKNRREDLFRVSGGLRYGFWNGIGVSECRCKGSASLVQSMVGLELRLGSSGWCLLSRDSSRYSSSSTVLFWFT